jgi:hypothetical protein
LILYFPISALVTLFANILQNPQDARARSDVKLMNLVVNFLSMLATDESNGSVKRMLGVCAEFERIAKVVLDRAERESQSKRKRKPAVDENGTLSTNTNTDSRPARSSPELRKSNIPPPTTNIPPTSNISPSAQSFSPTFADQIGGQSAQSPLHEFHSPQSESQIALSSGAHDDLASGDVKLAPDYSHAFSDILSPDGIGPAGFSDGSTFATSNSLPVDISAFQQPFVPQDLWQMPMTLEWDWADMSNSAFQFGSGNGQL